MTAPVAPDLETFRELAKQRRVIPVARRLLGDAETPIGVYRKLAGDRPRTFLLESAEHGGVWSRYSFVGASAPAVLTEQDGAAVWLGSPPAGLPSGGDPLAALGETVRLLHTEPLPGLPPLTGGLVGYLAYDVVRRLERLPDTAVDDLALPEIGMMLATDLAVLDHADGSVCSSPRDQRRHTDVRVDGGHETPVRAARPMTPTCAPLTTTVAGRHADARAVRDADVRLPAASSGQGGDRRARRSRSVVSQRFESSTASPGRLPDAACHQPEPVHVPPALSTLRHRGSSPEALVKGHRWTGVHAPDRRQRVPGGDAGGGRRARRRTCSLTRRSAAST
jgi:anthranilate synthase component 1